MKRYKYSNIKIKIEDKPESVKLIVHLKETKNPYYKSYAYKALDKYFDNRFELINYLKEYVLAKLSNIIY